MAFYTLKTIESLKKRLLTNNRMIIQNEDGYIAEIGFLWNKPASDELIEKLENENHIILPEDFKQFLKISNGATIFKDLQYGQWGCKILGLEDLIKVTREVRKRGYKLRQSWLIFATWLGDGDVLVFDMDKYREEKNNYIIDGDQGYQTDDWEYIKSDFRKWLDRLIVAQGAKYWRWC